MKGLIWLIIGIIVGTFFGTLILGLFLDNLFEGASILKYTLNYTG